MYSRQIELLQKLNKERVKESSLMITVCLKGKDTGENGMKFWLDLPASISSLETIVESFQLWDKFFCDDEKASNVESINDLNVVQHRKESIAFKDFEHLTLFELNEYCHLIISAMSLWDRDYVVKIVEAHSLEQAVKILFKNIMA